MDNLNLFMGLAPPTNFDPAYGSLVINAKGTPLGDAPSGEVIAKMFGFSDKDSMGSALDEIVQMADKLNVAITITGSSVEHTINVYLNNVDPAKPDLPPIKNLLEVLQRDLQAGKIGNVQINVATPKTDSNAPGPNGPINQKDAVPSYEEVPDDYTYSLSPQDLKDDETLRAKMSKDAQDNINIGRQLNVNANFSTPSISFGHGVGGNSWFAGNAYVTFLVSFMELQRILMQSKVVQGNIELAAMNLTVQMAKETSDLIKDIAKLNMINHIVAGVMAGVSIVFSCGGMYMGAKGIGGKAGYAEMGQMVNSLGTSLDKMTTSFTAAATDLATADKEGAKEVQQSIRQLITRQMEKSGDAFKSQEDMIQQLLQTLDKIRDGLMQAIAAALRK